MKKYIYAFLAAYDFMVDGVKVIVQPSGNSIVQIQTAIMNALTECGTPKHDKNAFKNILDKVSA